MIGAAGGACDGSEAEETGSDDATVAAGWPFVGQFVAHDITADRSPLRSHAEEERLRNFRTPRAQPRVRLRRRPRRQPVPLRARRPGQAAARPGRQRRAAQPGGPRADRRPAQRRAPVRQPAARRLPARAQPARRPAARGRHRARPDVFDEARRATMWHYQWILLHDYLPILIGAELTAELADGGPALLRDRRASRTSRSSSPTPRSATDTARSATATDQRHERELSMFPDLMGFGAGAARARGRLGAALRPARASRRRSARSGWTAGCPRA